MFSTLALKHHTGFPLVGHFSPSISKWRQVREKSCPCICIRAHPSVTRFHTHMNRKQAALTTGPMMHPQEVSMSEHEREVEIGCSYVFNSKATVVDFVIGFLSNILVTQRFLLILCLQPLGLISFIVTACVG